ncbi:unnamed protein product [Rotaria sordida]|uniref:Uncharacterized protein n=1 Tax=Rotaria sordida TaxID=392033 RepID=A0A819QQC2_9BILA|nr:unnamed protein product [Rotaria sordida]CAF4029118.1 unnamed protein product [Rotaria sordida]
MSSNDAQKVMENVASVAAGQPHRTGFANSTKDIDVGETLHEAGARVVAAVKDDDDDCFSFKPRSSTYIVMDDDKELVELDDIVTSSLVDGTKLDDNVGSFAAVETDDDY